MKKTAPTRPQPANDPTSAASSRPKRIAVAADGTLPPAGTERPKVTGKNEWGDVLAVVSELEQQLNRYDEMRAALQRELNDLSETHQATKQHEQELEWQVVALQARADSEAQTRHEVTLLEEELNDAKAGMKRVQSQLGVALEENAKLNEQLKQTAGELEQLVEIRAECDERRAENLKLKSDLQRIETARREIDQQRQAAESKFEETRGLLEQARAARHQAELNLRVALDRNRESKLAREQLEQQLEAARTQARALRAQAEHSDRQQARNIEQQQYYERELTSLRSVNRSTEAALCRIKKAFQDVRGALAETRARARRRATDGWPQLGETAERLLTDLPASRALVDLAKVERRSQPDQPPVDSTREPAQAYGDPTRDAGAPA